MILKDFVKIKLDTKCNLIKMNQTNFEFLLELKAFCKIVYNIFMTDLRL